MATDYGLLEEELKKEKAKLEKELHMCNVRKLYKKQQYLAREVIQRKQIETLEKQIAELEPTVSTLYSPQYAVKDNEIVGYLIYLLKMRDFFEGKIAKKEETIQQLDLKIEVKFRELCALTREQANVIKNKSTRSREFIHLENMTNNMDQMNKRICTMRQENKEITDAILDMRTFQKQFISFETEFRRKINYFKNRRQELLEKSVTSYKEKDEFMSKQRAFEKRHSQDLRKTSIHENVLNLCLQRTEKNEAFAALQAELRTDNRLTEVSDMIEERVTGLEPSIVKMGKLQTTISEAAEEDTPEDMEESFRVTRNTIDGLMSYLDELLNDINRLQSEINTLKKQYLQQIKSISSTDKKFCTEIKEKQDEVKECLKAVEEEEKLGEEAKCEMNSTLDIVKSLYATCCSEDALSSEQTPIDETNVIEYLQKMEKQLLDYLLCDAYIKMKEASKETKPLILEADKDEDTEEEVPDVDHKEILLPEEILSETDLSEDELEIYFLQFEQLKEQALAAKDKAEYEKNKDDYEPREDEEKEYY